MKRLLKLAASVIAVALISPFAFSADEAKNEHVKPVGCVKISSGEQHCYYDFTKKGVYKAVANGGAQWNGRGENKGSIDFLLTQELDKAPSIVKTCTTPIEGGRGVSKPISGVCDFVIDPPKGSLWRIKVTSNLTNGSAGVGIPAVDFLVPPKQ